MSTLYFENHPEPVFVADGYGFKAPKSWGSQVAEPEPDCCPDERPDYEIEAFAQIDQTIEEAEALVASITAEHGALLSELMDQVRALDVKILTSSGVEYEAMLQNQRHLKLRQADDIRAKTVTETAHQRERVAKLKELRSRKRKDLS